MAAAVIGDAVQVQAVLDAGGSDLEARDDDGCTAFLRTCFHGHVACMEALSKAGCDKQATANKGWTGLMFAVSNGMLAVVQAMLDAAGSRFKMHRPASWPEQAALLASGQWEDFVALTETLAGS